MRFKLVAVGAALLGVLVLGVGVAGADQTFKSGLYQGQPYTCAGGSMIDPSGQSFGTFQVTETHNYPSQLVQGWLAVDNMKPHLYSVFVTEYGFTCTSPVAQWVPGQPDQPIYMLVGANGHGSVHFSFWAHTRETSAWVTVQSVQQYGKIMTVRSMAVPINR
jgi:hypothetical protein